MGYWLRGHEGKSCFSIEEKMKHDFWWNNFFETTGHAYFLDIIYATSCSNKSWRQITLCVQVGWLNAATHHSDKSLRVYQRIFVKIFVSTAKFYCHNKLHKFCLIWFFATCRRDKSLLQRQRFSKKFSSIPKAACHHVRTNLHAM